MDIGPEKCPSRDLLGQRPSDAFNRWQRSGQLSSSHPTMPPAPLMAWSSHKDSFCLWHLAKPTDRRVGSGHWTRPFLRSRLVHPAGFAKTVLHTRPFPRSRAWPALLHPGRSVNQASRADTTTRSTLSAARQPHKQRVLLWQVSSVQCHMAAANKNQPVQPDGQNARCNWTQRLPYDRMDNDRIFLVQQAGHGNMPTSLHELDKPARSKLNRDVPSQAGMNDAREN